MKVYGAGAAGQGPTRIFLNGVAVLSGRARPLEADEVLDRALLAEYFPEFRGTVDEFARVVDYHDVRSSHAAISSSVSSPGQRPMIAETPDLGPWETWSDEGSKRRVLGDGMRDQRDGSAAAPHWVLGRANTVQGIDLNVYFGTAMVCNWFSASVACTFTSDFRISTARASTLLAVFPSTNTPN
jgi:hypothetical protein